MTRRPILLRSATAIGDYPGIRRSEAYHLHRTGTIPTFRVGGTPYVTTGTFAECQALQRAKLLPSQ